ncbi:MAG: trypsin-like peptidase domain-containing protein [Candidatus Doudnabacteria bacterium]|nr:trypsin-like peptidase domain-containing protein [Candidatus Doudnabacteria bacterium]
MKRLAYLLPALILFLIFGAVYAAYFVLHEGQLNQAKNFDEKIALLQKQIAGLQGQLMKVSGEIAGVALRPQEVINREIIREKSQDELLTQAVARVTPAVVSIVVSKDVPKLEVVYENPFGDDPFFKDFNIRIPVYRQKGVERQRVGAGTGFLIRSDGYILTNRHVVADEQAQYTVLLSDGSQKEAQVVYRDPAHDAALIRIEGGGYKTVSLGDSGTLKLGQTVFAIGNALGEYNNSVSVGIVSGLDRTITASGTQLAGVIQTDAAINPGNSGGPLSDLSGKVVGVSVATVIGSSNISFAIPVNQVKEIVRQALK